MHLSLDEFNDVKFSEDDMNNLKENKDYIVLGTNLMIAGLAIFTQLQCKRSLTPEEKDMLTNVKMNIASCFLENND